MLVDRLIPVSFAKFIGSETNKNVHIQACIKDIVSSCKKLRKHTGSVIIKLQLLIAIRETDLFKLM